MLFRSNALRRVVTAGAARIRAKYLYEHGVVGIEAEDNERVGKEVRETMRKEGATLPEDLPVEPPIAVVRKRLAKDGPQILEPPKA
jgi:hypothetical protein